MIRLRNLYIAVVSIGLLLFFTSSAIASNDQYRVGVNDVLDIRLLGDEQIKGQFQVTSDGTINFPYIGTVNVKNKSITEIKEEITKKLSEGYIKYPVVSVSLIRSGKRIITFGELRTRGEILFQDNMTVMAGLSLAGGVTEDGLYGKVKVRRKQSGAGGSYSDIAESELDFGAIVKKDVEGMLLKPDDILIVGKNKSFLIQGEVHSRGRFSLEKDMTVLSALLQAGGVTTESSYGKVKVRRKQSGTTGGYADIAESELDSGAVVKKDVEGMLLKPDDILIVEKNKSFLIQGEVLNRGRFILEKDMTVLRALLQAGGVTKDGLYGTLKVRRKHGESNGEYKDLAESALNYGVIEKKSVEEMLISPDDVMIVEKNKTFLIQGEAAQRGRMVLEKDMTVLTALLQAGGVTKDGLYGKLKVRRKVAETKGEYKEIASANLADGVIENKDVEQIFLEPDDVMILERSESFLMYGELNRTGEFTLTDDMTVFKAITNAGGFTKWGSQSGIKILRKKKDNIAYETIKVNIKAVMDGDAAADILLKPKDIVIVSTGIF